MEERLARVGRSAWWLTGLAAVLVIVGAVAWYFRVIIPPLVFAGAIVFLLNPIVSFLERRGVRRVLGTAIAFGGVVVLLIGLGAILYPLVSSQADEVAERWPELQADAEEWIDDLSARSDADNWPVHLPSVQEIEDQAGSAGDAELGEQVATVREYATRAFEVGLIFVLGPILAFYLLIDLPDVRRRCEELIPDRARTEVLFIAHRLNAAIGGFFRGQLAVAITVGVMASIGLRIIDLPLWLVVGMIAGIFNMIPLIGPWIGAVPGIVVALATRDVKTAVGVVIVMVVVQQIDNHLITPTVMRRAVQLHPAAVMMALLAWGSVGGFFGLLLAVPLTATLKILGGHLWRKWVVGVSVPGLDEPYPDRLVVAHHGGIAQIGAAEPPEAREDLPNDVVGHVPDDLTAPHPLVGDDGPDAGGDGDEEPGPQPAP